LSVVDHSRRRICALPTPAVLELSVKLGSTDQELTDLSVPVQLATEAILSFDAPEENVSMTVNVLWTELVLISTADPRARMRAVRTRSVRHGTTERSVPVHQDTSEIH